MTWRACVATALFVAAAGGCYGDPAGLQQEPCYLDYTANLGFTTGSATGSSYDVLLDGNDVATLAPGTSSRIFAVQAWVLHVVSFNYTGTDSAACPREIYTPSRCETHNFVCRE